MHVCSSPFQIHDDSYVLRMITNGGEDKECGVLHQGYGPADGNHAHMDSSGRQVVCCTAQMTCSVLQVVICASCVG